MSERPRAARSAAGRNKAPLIKRLGWMALIWMLSVAALGVVAMILRAWIA